MSETTLSVRGFNEKSVASRDLLETVGSSFLTGYAYAAESSSPAEAEEQLETIPHRFRGFAYEGAGMGFAVRDGLPGGGTHHVTDFLAGRGQDHVYMVYVGVGWALARVPRFRWRAAATSVTDPLLRWLVLDGYGFHQAYFQTEKYVRQQYVEPAFPWPPEHLSSYANRVIDQGIGRAMWFVGGTDAALVADMIDGFPEPRRSDLYSGAGLAASYAGGVDEDELRLFWRRAGTHRPMVAQASAFAAEARVRAGLVTPHTKLATEVFCGMGPQEAAQITDKARPTRPATGQLPAFEVWRQDIADEFASLGRV